MPMFSMSGFTLPPIALVPTPLNSLGQLVNAQLSPRMGRAYFTTGHLAAPEGHFRCIHLAPHAVGARFQ